MPPTLDALSDREFRQLARQWLDDHVVGDYAALRGRGGPGDEDVGFDVRVEWKRDLGGAESMLAGAGANELGIEQKLFLFSRADTIYGGSNEVQRNVIGERVLGLPKEPQ